MKVANFLTIPQLGESGLPSLLSSVADALTVSLQSAGGVNTPTDIDLPRKEKDASFDTVLAMVAGQVQSPLTSPTALAAPTPLDALTPVRQSSITPPAASEANQLNVPMCDVPVTSSSSAPDIRANKRVATPQPLVPSDLIAGAASASVLNGNGDPNVADVVSTATATISHTSVPDQLHETSDFVDVGKLVPEQSSSDTRNLTAPHAPPLSRNPNLPPGRGTTRPEPLATLNSRDSEAIPPKMHLAPEKSLTPMIDFKVRLPVDREVETPGDELSTQSPSVAVIKLHARIPGEPQAAQGKTLSASASPTASVVNLHARIMVEGDLPPSDGQTSPDAPSSLNVEEATATATSEALDPTQYAEMEHIEIGLPARMDSELRPAQEDLTGRLDLRETKSLFVLRSRFQWSRSDDAPLEERVVPHPSSEIVVPATSTQESPVDVQARLSKVSDLGAEATDEKMVRHKASHAENTIRLDSHGQSLHEVEPSAHFHDGDSNQLPERVAATVHAHRDDLSDGKPIELRLRLDPPELGSIRVHVKLTDDVVSVRLIAGDEAATRILEDQLPDLRQSLAERGLAFVRCDVSCDSGRQHQSGFQQDLNRPNGPLSRPRPSAWAKTSTAAAHSSARMGRVDVLA